MKRRYIKIAFTLITVLAVTIAGTTIARFYTIADIPGPDKTPHLQVNVRALNFKPSTTYLMTLENGDQLEITSTPTGEINSSQVLPYTLGVKKIMRFDFAEKNPIGTDSPSIEVILDTNNQQIIWKGQYFKPSAIITSDISDKQDTVTLSAKSDWNGNFVHNATYNGINLIEENACLNIEDDGQSICLAFGVRRSPQLLEVLTVPPSVAGTSILGIVIPGTGNPSDDPFTPFDTWEVPSDCTPLPAPFFEELSLCDTSHVAGLQEDLSKSYYDFTRMTMQLSAGMMQQVGFLGILYDAKHQLETQLMFWEKQERAHNDYHPSEQLCTIASMTKELAALESRRDLNTFGISRALSFADQNPIHSSTARGSSENYQIRTIQFRETYCAPTNFNTALRVWCDGLSAGNVARMNRDIDYASLISIPKTLDVDITDGVDSTADEEDVMSMGRLLFGHETIDFPQPTNDPAAENAMNDPEFINNFQEYRSISAIRNVARYSYANMVGMKAEGSGFSNAQIQALLGEFGMPTTDIERFIGENPSYFAQMHVLTKQVFQHPNFYTNLITKEANIARFETTMEALHLMSKRDRYETALRKEMLLSLLVEMKIRDLYEYGVDQSLRAIGSRNNPR